MIQVDPYKALMYTMYGLVGFCTYAVYFFCATFPVQEQPPSYSTIIHVGIVIVMTELFKVANMTCFFAVIFKVVDKRMAAFHVTLLATLYNLSYLVHKLYIYKVLECFGIYWAQGFLVIMAVSFLTVYKD